MKRIMIVILVTITITGGIIGSLYMMWRSNNKNNAKIEDIEISDKITDECIDEYNELETAQENVEKVNAEEEEKVSPGAIITFEKFYKDCEHTVNRYEEAPTDIVNTTREEIEKKYDSWTLKEFYKDKIVLYKEIDGNCNEHYMLRDLDGKIAIYKLDENGEETLINETDISTKYLTQTDQFNIENGLIVYGKENLNQLLEDYE